MYGSVKHHHFMVGKVLPYSAERAGYFYKVGSLIDEGRRHRFQKGSRKDGREGERRLIVTESGWNRQGKAVSI